MQPVTFPDVLFHPCLLFPFLDNYAYFETKELQLPTIFIPNKFMGLFKKNNSDEAGSQICPE